MRLSGIGVLTSGGDAPGMNAAIRAVTRSAIYNGYTVKGIFRGYDGLINDEIKTFTTENVSGIIGTGGTILKTARSKEFMTDEGRQKAFETIQKEEIDALVKATKELEEYQEEESAPEDLAKIPVLGREIFPERSHRFIIKSLRQAE